MSAAQRWSHLFSTALLGMLLLLTGCGGGGSPAPLGSDTGSGTGSSTGSLEIGLTDAEGEFARYRIRVGALRLMADGGAEVVIPLGIGVDFTELVELTEMLTVADVPVGRYRSLILELDFNGAEIVLQNADGTLTAANPEDASGAGPGVVEVEIELSGDTDLAIVADGLQRLTLDFDLALSNERHPTAASRLVVEPVVLALPGLERGRPHRISGLLREVDVNAAVVGVDLRPFQRPVATPGALRFRVDANTHYLIDGVPFAGNQGLEQLAAQAPGTRISAMGTVTDGVLTAARVMVGNSVPGNRIDSIRGVVLARDGDRALVGGAVVQHPGGSERFEQRLLLLLGPDTSVTLPRGDAVVGAAAVSVGSRLLAFGTLDVTEDDLTVLDASAGRVQLFDTALTGEVRGLDPFTVDLLLLAGRQPGAFDFGGTGSSTENDADPNAYVIAREGPIAADPEVGDLVRARGRIQDFGMAPPDFLALQLTDADAGPRRAVLQAAWARPGTREAFTGIGADRIGLDISDARAVLRVAGIERDLLPEDGQLNVVATDESTALFVLTVAGRPAQRQFRDFSAFTAALLELDASGHPLLRFGTQGRYNPATTTFEAQRLQAVFGSLPAP